jgi:hypothetical protein
MNIMLVYLAVPNPATAPRNLNCHITSLIGLKAVKGKGDGIVCFELGGRIRETINFTLVGLEGVSLVRDGNYN